MRRLWFICIAIMLLLSACGSGLKAGVNSNETPASQPSSLCGNGICENGETASTCQQDCGGNSADAVVKTTYIKSEGSSGRIAVMVASPKVKRYPEGAGVVVVVPSLFSNTANFSRDPNLASIGLIQVSYLWPGNKDKATGVQSDGEFDYGGPNSIMILRDVIRFAGGRLADVNGRYVFGLATIPPLTDEVGLYAFGDAGLAAVKALSLYGDQYQGLQYYIGRETPTDDSLASEEIGYYDSARKPVYNPFYIYPASYSFDLFKLNYTNLHWDASYVSGESNMAGRPYLDLDGNGVISGGDYIFDGFTPVISGKRYYSISLTQALIDSGALTPSDWPGDVATPQEATSFWSFLQSPDPFAVMQNNPIIRNLKVMLVFAQEDHAQVAEDKPHIHQAYQGFRFEARLWVRLNPDRAYVQELLQKDAEATQGSSVPTAEIIPILDFPDNPANTQTDDWTKIGAYAYPANGTAARLVPLAAVAEMADRAHSGVWDENIGAPLFFYTGPTPTP
jgi:hypothetical protein